MPYYAGSIGIPSRDIVNSKLQLRAHGVHELLKELENRLQNRNLQHQQSTTSARSSGELEQYTGLSSEEWLGEDEVLIHAIVSEELSN